MEYFLMFISWWGAYYHEIRVGSLVNWRVKHLEDYVKEVLR